MWTLPQTKYTNELSKSFNASWAFLMRLQIQFWKCSMTMQMLRLQSRLLHESSKTFYKALAKRLDFSVDFCYAFELQKSSDVLCCGQTVRHFTIQSTRLIYDEKKTRHKALTTRNCRAHMYKSDKVGMRKLYKSRETSKTTI